jgi:hypothetical protein
MDDMMTKLVAAVIDRLKSNWPKAAEFDINRDFANIISWPSLAVTVEKIGVERQAALMEQGAGSYEFRPVVSVYMVFKAVQPTPRREGVYPMVTAVAALLLGQTFGLEIAPLEPDGPIIEIVSAELVKTGAVCYKMDLKTAFAIDTGDGGEMERLLVTANDYHYKMWESGTQVIEHT